MATKKPESATRPAIISPAENPSTSAWWSTGTGTPPAPVAAPAAAAPAPLASCVWTLFATAVQATVPMAARPIAPPICWPTLSTPEAAPCSSLRTCETTMSVIGTNMSPSPALTTSIGGSRFGQ
jgi:hypothetical protein